MSLRSSKGDPGPEPWGGRLRRYKEMTELPRKVVYRFQSGQLCVCWRRGGACLLVGLFFVNETSRKAILVLTFSLDITQRSNRADFGG